MPHTDITLQTEPQLILGPPGTGKTTRLVGSPDPDIHSKSILFQEIASGVRPDRIAFVTFTRKAADEAIQRTIDCFGFKRGDLPFFRTLHSMAFSLLGVQHGEVLSSKHYREIGALLGLQFSSKADLAEDGPPIGQFNGDQYVFLNNFARTRCMTFEDAWHMVAPDQELNWYEFRRFNSLLEQFKKDKFLIDFTDMLERCPSTLDVDVAIIDEGQDFSTLQWQLAFRLFKNVKRLYIAGDDDQSIFQWSGADVNAFINLPGKRQVLNVSHRLPRSVHKLANDIVSRISVRVPKKFACRDEDGSVEFHRQPDDVDFRNGGSWLLLARNTYLLQQLVKIVRDAGMPYLYRGESALNQDHIRAIQIWEAMRKGKQVPADNVKLLYEHMKPRVGYAPGSAQLVGKLSGGFYSLADLQEKFGLLRTSIWHEMLTGIPQLDREFYISLLRRGEKLTSEPRVAINTFHGVKGGEADNVLMLTDVSYRTYNGMQTDPDSEHRVFYVGATRARQDLHVVLPQTRYAYEI